MTTGDKIVLASIASFILGALVASVSLWDAVQVPVSEVRHGAIDRGYALYCPTTGEWAWKGECGQ